MSNRGSEWRKWDLHFHTPSSYDYGDKSITNEKIIDILGENEISVVAITDHHLIDVDKIIELQEIGKRKNITVLPGIEFRAELGGSESIHYIGIFSEKLQKQELNDIWIKLQSTCKITQTDIKEIGGDANIQCDFKETSKLIHDLGGLITVHAGSKANTFENITNSLPDKVAQKVGLVKDYIDIFELGKEVDQLSYNQKVFPNLGFRLPMIICSDNHKITDYIIKQNLWIKANPTFEGLKQIIYEPLERVKIQSEKPDFKEDKVVIDEVKFICSGDDFTPNSIKFNQNMNVIIGGKSSGKSILLYNIARTLSTDDKLFKDEKIEDKYNFRGSDNPDINFNFLVKTKVGVSQLRFDDPNKNIMPDIKYIPQSYLIKLAEPELYKTGDSLNKVIRNLIIEDPKSKIKYDDVFKVNVKANDKERERIIENYFQIKSKIIDLETSLSSKSNEEVLEKNIQSNLDKINELKKSVGLNEEEISKYNSLQKDLEIINNDAEKITNDFKKVVRFNKETENSLNELKRQKDILSLSLENQQIKGLFDDTYRDLDNLINNLDQFIVSYEHRFLDDGEPDFLKENIFKSLLTDISAHREKNERELEPYRKNEVIEKNIKSLESSIEEDRKNLNLIIQLNKEITTFQDEMKSEKYKLFNLYKKSVKEYFTIVESLKGRVKVLEKEGLVINGLVKFNFPKFRKNLWEISHGGSKSYKNWNIFDDKLSALDSYNAKDFIQDMKQIFVSIEDGKYSLLSRIDKIHAVKTLLDDYFFDYWEIEYKGDKLGKMSTGKASFVILMMIVGLSESKSPILIDQPEDNLDNRSVSRELVEYLKDKKKERQIILVTHNPNIVVNADAENVIIANQNGQNDTGAQSLYQFDYINGSLENSFPKIEMEKDVLKSMGIREHIADIVEGGKEAFKKREEKYGF